MAFEAWRNPDTLNVSDAEKLRFEFDSGEVEEVTVDEVRTALNEYRSLFNEFRDWNSGIYTVTRTEYKSLPSRYISAKRLFDSLTKREK